MTPSCTIEAARAASPATRVGTIHAIAFRIQGEPHDGEIRVRSLGAVPGPQRPLYLLGAKLLESYPCVPLMGDLALGIALFSHDGGVFWGFDADWESLPDVHDFMLATQAPFEELRALATEAVTRESLVREASGG